jgi:hypothetical protein
MIKTGELTYKTSKSYFYKLKPILNGFAFWREEGDDVVVRFGSKKLEAYFIKK